jgi:Protein of unknown function (DUF2848)
MATDRDTGDALSPGQAGSAQLTFVTAGSGRPVSVSPGHLVIAGFTGRDEASVTDHVRELAAIGVRVPAVVPAFWQLDLALLTADEVIEVAGLSTSGEAEPVIVRHEGRLYLGLGSDHTDRDLERADIAGSKAVCPKPVSRQVVELPAGGDNGLWDCIELSCAVDGVPYQQGTLAALRRPSDLLARLQSGGDLVMFCGTLPLLHGEFVAGTTWDLRLQVPGQAPLRHRYRVRLRPGQLTDPAHQGVA